MVATPTRFESKTVAALAPAVEVTVKIGLSWLSTTVNGPTFSSLLIRCSRSASGSDLEGGGTFFWPATTATSHVTNKSTARLAVSIATVFLRKLISAP